MKRIVAAFLCPLIASTMVACTTTKLDSYVSPSYSARTFSSVAILPLTNQRINAGQAIELNRAFIQEVQHRNPRLHLIGGQDAIALLNEKNLADTWAVFLSGYATSGVPNTHVLSQVARALNVDAVVVGSVIRVRQEDSNGWTYPVTEVSIRYTMFSGSDGAIQWEVTGDGKYQPYGWTAPPVFEAAKLAHDKILTELPIQ